MNTNDQNTNDENQTFTEVQYQSKVEYHSDGTATYTFPQPMQGHGREIKSIHLKRFTVQTMDDIRNIKDGYDYTRKLFQASTGLADNEIVLIDSRSYTEISNIISDFL